MAIHAGILNTYRAKHVIALKGDQTLNHAIQQLQQNRFPEQSTYLVVAQSAEQYQVALFPNLGEIVRKLGPDSLILPLAALPLPPATRVERQDTQESGKSIGDWLRANPRANLVVVDDSGFVGLLVNIYLSGGLFGKIQFSILHGPETNLGEDYREALKPLIDADACPHCGERVFCKYDVDRGVYFCPECTGSVER